MTRLLNGTGSVLALCFSALFASIGVTWIVMIIFHGGRHAVADDIFVGVMMLVSLALAVPADAQAAIRVMRPIVPWRTTDSGEWRNDDPAREEIDAHHQD